MSTSGKFSKEPIVQPPNHEQLQFEDPQNVIPIGRARAAGHLALVGRDRTPDTEHADPHADLGGGVRGLTPGQVKELRSPIVSELMSTNQEFQEYVKEEYGANGHKIFKAPDGLSLTHGLDVLRMLGQNSKGDVARDIPDFLRDRRPSENRKLTERETSVLVLQAHGLDIIRDAVAYYRMHGDKSDAARNALRAISGPYANLHTDTYANGAVDIFSDVIEVADELLVTYGVFRTESGTRKVLRHDPVLNLETLRSGIATSAGFRSAADIQRSDIVHATAVLQGNLPNPAA